MALPIRTTVEDIEKLCNYLVKKPTGATVKEAKSVLDHKVLDGRKLAALKTWGLIEDQERLKLTSEGREAARNNGAGRAVVLGNIVRRIAPYHAIIERAAHRREESMTATDVAVQWHEHFADDVSSNEKILNDQAVCFFQLVSGAHLGTLIVGRRGSPTRIEFDLSTIVAFVDGEDTYSSNATDDPFPNSVDARQDDNQANLNGAREPADDRELGQGIFVAHGRNKKPLEQLKKILDQFRIPYKVAVEEPNLGRPISAKVRETMRACNCAILIFTADEEFQDKNGNTIWRPSENVVFELGAAGYLYGNRVVILKEDSVEFPANFKDLGYISFGKDQLDAQSMDVIRELIGFGIVKIST